MKAIILNLKKSETLKKVKLFFKGIMNKLSLKEYIYSVMIEHNENCLYATTSEVEEIVKDEVNLNYIGDEHIEDVVRNMDLVYEHDLVSGYEVDDKIADALEDKKNSIEPITSTQWAELQNRVIVSVVEILESRKSPTIKEVEQNQKNMKLAFNIMLKMATKRDVLLTSDNNKLIYDLLDNYLNGGNENMK